MNGAAACTEIPEEARENSQDTTDAQRAWGKCLADIVAAGIPYGKAVDIIKALIGQGLSVAECDWQRISGPNDAF